MELEIGSIVHCKPGQRHFPANHKFVAGKDLHMAHVRKLIQFEPDLFEVVGKDHKWLSEVAEERAALKAPVNKGGVKR